MKLRSAGLVIDQVAGANAKTGTSNDGNTARKMFLQKNQELIVDCVEDKYKEVIRELHKKISVLLRVISSCSQKVNYTKIVDLTTDISLLIADKLPWVEINWTLHGVLHHSAELIFLNGGWALGILSEEAIESNNKFVRRYLNQYARTSSPILQLTDAMSRLLERSDPSIQHHQREIRNQIKCDVCKMKHKTKNHDKYAELYHQTVLNEYDSLVIDFLYSLIYIYFMNFVV